MRYVFTDIRFPGVEVISDGKTKFEVLEDKVLTESFASRENASLTVSEAYAKRVARRYFNDLDHEIEQVIAEDLGLPEDRDHTEVFNAEPGEEIPVTADEVLDTYERVRRTDDPELKRKLMARVQKLAGKFESAAGAVVGLLLDDG